MSEDTHGHAAHGAGKMLFESEGLRTFALACICAGLAYALAWLMPEYAQLAYGVGAGIAVIPFALTAVRKAARGQPSAVPSVIWVASAV